MGTPLTSCLLLDKAISEEPRLLTLNHLRKGVIPQRLFVNIKKLSLSGHPGQLSH